MKILMPQLGETVTEGTISAWHKNVGDEVEKDESLLDVETDKVATEIPAPVSGVLRQILVAQDETVDVGTVLAIIGDEDELIEYRMRQTNLDQSDDASTAVDISPLLHQLDAVPQNAMQDQNFHLPFADWSFEHGLDLGQDYRHR